MIRSFPLLKSCFLTIFVVGASACGGGGGSDDSGVLLEGTLTEDGGAGHDKAFNFRHSSGQRIGNVQICGLGECSTTDDEGQWGFVLPGEFTGGDVELSVIGHGISSSAVVNVPAGSTEMFLGLRHVEGGIIEVDTEEHGEDHHG